MGPTEAVSASGLGWSQRELDQVFDEPDIQAPSTHYRNPYGEPLYAKNRLAVGLWRCGEGPRPRMSKATEDSWLQSYQPTIAPVLTFDLNALAAKYEAGVKGEPWVEPVKAAYPEPRQYRVAFLAVALVAMLRADTGKSLETLQDALAELRSRSEGAALRLGAPWPNVIVRRVWRGGYVSRATGPKVLAKALDALSLVLIVAVFMRRGDERTLVGFLDGYPALRFDSVLAPARRGTR